MNSRRRFLRTASATAGGFVFATAAEASAKVSVAKGRGPTILHGAGAPSRRNGIVGDFYIDTRAHSIYGPKSTGGWGHPTSLIGPQGPAGAGGAAGTAIDGGSL